MTEFFYKNPVFIYFNSVFIYPTKLLFIGVICALKKSRQGGIFSG
jgi:hypothetical protein